MFAKRLHKKYYAKYKKRFPLKKKLEKFSINAHNIHVAIFAPLSPLQAGNVLLFQLQWPVALSNDEMARQQGRRNTQSPTTGGIVTKTGSWEGRGKNQRGGSLAWRK